MPSKKSLRSIFTSIFAFGLFAGVGLYSYSAITPATNQIALITVCTKDVFTCPDGTKVGRTGQACEFNCPTSTNQASLYFDPIGSGQITSQTDTHSVKVFISSQVAISAATMIINYDPSLIEVITASPSAALPTTISSAVINQNTGSVKFTYGVSLDSSVPAPSSPILVTELTYRAKPNQGETGTSFNFSSDSVITSQTQTTGLSIDQGVHQIALAHIKDFLAGDLNQDGTVNLFDFNLLVAKFGDPYTIFDFNAIVVNYGKTN